MEANKQPRKKNKNIPYIKSQKKQIYLCMYKMKSHKINGTQQIFFCLLHFSFSLSLCLSFFFRSWFVCAVCLPCFACIYKLKRVVRYNAIYAYISGCILLSFTKLSWFMSWFSVCACVFVCVLCRVHVVSKRHCM